jgi:DNA-binding SARP family transcriptional activator
MTDVGSLERAAGRPRPDWRILRHRLVSRVERALDTGAVLITAGPGCGKTTLLEDAAIRSPHAVAWISCSDADRNPGVFVMRLVDAIAAAAPGASNALAERLRGAPEALDPLAATRELIAELSRLLVEPITVVIDDAERLDGAAEALQLVRELANANRPRLRVAVAARHRIDLGVAKLRASGELVELGAADLAFDPEECAGVVAARTGLDPSPEQVSELIEATEGWPLGIVVAAGLIERSRVADVATVPTRHLAGAPELHAYLSEELLRSLDPDLREAAVSSSIVEVVTPQVARALGLPEDLEVRLGHAGLPIRRPANAQGFVYHPLVRQFLLQCLQAERSADEWRRLNAAAAASLAEAGDPINAIEHWLAARRWPEAAAAIEQQGLALLRTSPALVGEWLSRLPSSERGWPTLLALDGQLAWVTGDNRRAIDMLQRSIRGFRERPNVPAEWVARSILVDLLFVNGGIDGVGEVIAGWDHPDAAQAFGLAPAAAAYAAAVFAAYARFEESSMLAEAATGRAQEDLIAPFDALRQMCVDMPRGRIGDVRECLEAALRAMERSDPLNRRAHVAGALASALWDCAEFDESLQAWERVRKEFGGGEVPIVTDATHAWCALLYARAGRPADAEAELAAHRRLETGARSFVAELAPALVAAIRGDGRATAAAGDRALAIVAAGPILFRVWVEAELVRALASCGLVERASELAADAIALVDEHYPESRGTFYRGRLLAIRAWLRDEVGDREGADSDLHAVWRTPDEALRHIVLGGWDKLRPLVWDAVARGLLEPEPIVASVAAAFPDGRPLVEFLEHPLAAARQAALGPAIRSGHPGAVSRLRQLTRDPDPGLAAAATRIVAGLGSALPPLRFQVLGGFAVGRGSWSGDQQWARPVDARLVRLLLVSHDRPVPEDMILEALWPELSIESARRSLHVAASRTRQILDVPGVERSVLARIDRSYRLCLDARDSVDADEFSAAARAALSERGAEQQALLEHARSLWNGEPLPEERYSDWATSYRESLIDRYTAVLTSLYELHERTGDHHLAADAALELVELDPLNEGAHRALMTAYARAGRTGRALRQYLQCRRTLVEQLGIEPAEATSRLQARILAGESL